MGHRLAAAKSWWAPATLCLVVAAAATWPVLLRDGWPYNHEALSLFQRTEAFRRAFLALDLWPVWTPFAHNGHGSAWPLFYHRLFTALSAALALPLGSLAGTKAAIFLTLSGGIAGALFAARSLSTSGWALAAVAITFGFAQYVFFDWLIRGAGAEFAAMMLVPWLLGLLIRTTRGMKSWIALALVLALLFFAHSIILLYAVFLFPGFALVAILRGQLRHWIAQVGLAAGVAAVICLPSALAILRMGPHFNLDVLHIFRPRTEFVSLGRFIWDDTFRWGRQWGNVGVEVGPAVIALAVLVLFLAALRRVRHGWADAAALLFPLAIYGYLLTPGSLWFFEASKYLELIQFPWRVLTYVTPLLILLPVALLDEVESGPRVWRWLTRSLLVVSAGVTVGLGARCFRLEYPVFPSEMIRADLRALDQPWSAREYLPRAVARRGVPPRQPFVATSGCTKVAADPSEASRTQVHLGALTVSASSGGECVVHLSQFVTPLLAVERSAGIAVEETPYRTYAFRLAPGGHTFTVRARSLFSIAFLSDSPR